MSPPCAFVDSVLGFYRRRLHARRVGGGRSGAVTAVQRVSSDLRLNPHFHTLALDGVFAEGKDGERGLGVARGHVLPGSAC